MANLKIIKYPNSILTKKAQKVKDPLDPKLQRLISRMTETLKSTPEGKALAAPQVRESVRLCIVQEEDKTLVFINPQITSMSKEKITELEGCLSFPGTYLPIARSSKIKVRYLDEKGKKAKIKAEGFLARALQHEIDHLDGILIINRTKKHKKITHS